MSRSPANLPRPLVVLALVGVVLALVAGLLCDNVATREAATRRLASSSLDELAWLAGLTDEHAVLQRGEPLPVVIVSDGGPMWTLDAVADAVARSEAFAEDRSPHLLRSEIIDEPGAIALQLHLWRNGWDLREPVARRIRVAPALVVIAALLGAFVAVFLGRVSAGLASAGLVAQLSLALDPLPRELFPPQSWAATWASGPLVSSVLGAVRGLGSIVVAVVAAIGAGALVLAIFDHRRSKGGERDIGLGPAALAATLGSLGAFAWIEAASRGALLLSCDLRSGAWLGLLAMLGLILAWLPAIRVAREAWRARAA